MAFSNADNAVTFGAVRPSGSENDQISPQALFRLASEPQTSMNREAGKREYSHHFGRHLGESLLRIR
jgi:hypothetical protein